MNLRCSYAPRTCAGVAWTSPSARDVREIPPASSRTTNSQSISSSARMRWVEGEATSGDDEVDAREGGTRGTRRRGNERRNERRTKGGVLLGIHSHRKRRENQKKLSAARFLPPPWESLDFVGFGGAEYVFP